MVATDLITVVYCFNDIKKTLKLTEKLKNLNPNIKFINCDNFTALLDVIGDKYRVDCFIIDEKFEGKVTADLVEMFKEIPIYEKSVFSLYTSNFENLDKTFLELGFNYYFDGKADVNHIADKLTKLIQKSLSPIIPKNFNVMVVDNNHDVLELITLHLNELNHYKIFLYRGIKEAISGLKENEYDMLLLDWNLDDGTCFDLIEYIESGSVSERTKAAVRVVITGRNEVEDIMKLLDYGIKDYIIKPFDFNEFEDKIDYAIEKHARKV